MILKDRVKTIARENDTFLSGTALLDTELLMGGYYYYTIKLKQTGTTIPMVRVDQPNTKLTYPINMIQVSVKKVNDTLIIVSQSEVTAESIATSSYYGRTGNGDATLGYDKQLQEEIAARQAYVIAELEKARLNLQFQVTEIVDPAGPLRTQITSDINQVRSDLTATQNGIQTQLNNLDDPASEVRQAVTNQINTTKATIEATNGVLGTRINNANTEITNAKSRLDAAESAITTINDPAGMLRQEIVSKIATAKAQIEAQGSVLDARFEAEVAAVDSKVTTINTVTIPQVNTNIINTVNTAKSDLTTLMDSKDSTLKTTIESTTGVLSTRIDTKDAALKTTIESSTGVLANLMDSKNTALKNVIEAGGSALNTRINNERDALIAQYGTETVNLISNGNANNGSVLSWQSGVTALLATTAEVPAGAPSRYVFKTGNGKSWMNKPKAVTGGSILKASYWVTTTTTSNNTSFGLTLQMLKKDGTYSFVGMGAAPSPATALNTWVQVIGQYTLPADIVEVTPYFEFKTTLAGGYAAVPWYFTNAELKNISESEPIKLRADQMYADVYVTNGGMKQILNTAVTDITSLNTNKASVTSVNSLTDIVNGQGGRITTTEGILTTNGLNGSSNIAGRVTTIESDLNTGVSSVKARLTTVESTKADTTALTAATNRVTALESGVTNSGIALVPPAFDDNWRLYIGNSPTGVNPGNSNVTGTVINELTTLRGKALKIVGNTPHLYQKQYIKIDPNKTYRVTLRYKANKLTTDNRLSVDVRAYQMDSNFAYASTSYISLGFHTATVIDQWHTLTYTVGKESTKKFSGDAIYTRFAFVGNWNQGSTDTTTILEGTYDYFLVEDITDISNSNSRITTVETTLNDPTSGVVTRLDSLTTTVSNNNTTLTGSINSLSTSKADLSALTSANTKIQTLENELNTSANGAANIKARLGTVENTVTTTNSAYATRLNNLESNYTAVTGKINTVDGVNKWRYIEYPRGSFAQQYPPTLVEWGKVVGTPSVSKLVDHSDGLFLATSNADVIVRGTTAVYVAIAKTINFTISADDGVRVFVNGEQVFFRANYAAGQTATIAANLRAGWNTLDISFGNGTGPGNAGNITPFLSTLVDYISLSEAIDYAPISTANAAITDEATTRANADSAAATRLTNLETSVNTNGTGLLARMTNAENTKVDNTTFTAATNRISTLESESVKELKMFDGTFNKDLDTWSSGLNGVSIPSNSSTLQLASITEGKVLQASTDFYSKGYIPVNPYRKYKVTTRYKFTNLGTAASNVPILYVLVASLDKDLINIAPVPAGGSYTYGSVKSKGQVAVDTWYEDSFIVSDVDAGSTSNKFRPNVAYAKFGMLVREGAVVQVQYILVEDATSVEQTNARITSVESTLTSADIAAANRLNTIESSINSSSNSLANLRTAITNEENSRTSADTTLGSRIDTLTSTVNTNKTTIEARALNIETTKANLSALNAEAARINSLEVAVNNKDNLVKNQAFETDLSFWSSFYPVQTTRLAYNAAGVPTGAPTPFVMKISGRDTANSPNWINATAGDTFYVSMWCANTATTTFNLNFMLHGNTLDNLSTYTTAVSRSATDAVGTWKKVEGIFTVPSNVHKFRIFLQQDRVATNTDNDNAWYVANIELRQTNTLKSSNAKITNLENVVINGGSSLVSKVSALETTVNVTGGGLTARLDTLNQIVTNSTTGLVTKLDSLTTETRTGFLNLTSNSKFQNGLQGWSEPMDGSSPGVINGASIVGGKFRISRTVWMHGPLIPVNTARTYRIRFKTRVVTDGTNPTTEQRVYAGVATYDANKTLQTVAPGTHRYCAAGGVNVVAADGWRTFEGTITGEGNANANQFRAGTVFVRPMFILNYGSGNAVVEAEYLEFEDITDLVTTNATISNLAQTVSNADSALASRATALETSVNTGPNNLTSLKGSITNLENTRATTTEVSNVSSKVSAIEASINHGTTGLASLNTRIIEVKNEKADLTALTSEANRITALNARVGIDASNLVGNPSADRGAEGWINVSTRTDSVAPTPNTFATSSRDNTYEPNNYRIPVTPGERYYFSMWTGTPVNHGIAISIGYRGHDKSDAVISFMAAARRESNDATGSWKQISGYLTIPAGTAYIVPWVQLDYTGSNATWFFTKVEVRSVSQNKEVDAKITTLESTVATSTSALATRATNLEAALTTGSGITNYAKLNEISSVSVDAQGKANATYGVELDVNGRATGWKNVNNGSSGIFSITADKFYIYNPTVGDSPVFGMGVVNGVNKLALRGDMIVDGAITANKLTIGNGVNLVPNSAFIADLTHPPVNSHVDSFWRFYNYNNSSAGLRADWAPYGKRSIYIEDTVATAASADKATLFSKPIPVDSSKYYAYSVLLNKHRADGSTAFIIWTDSSDNNATPYYGNVVGNSYSTIRKTVSRPGPVGAIVYDEHFVAAQPPANARYARLVIQKGHRNAGEASSYVFATEVMFESSNSPITEPSPWSEGSYTTIDGGMIQTGFISANRIAANTINANHITSNAITVDKLDANSVSTDKIQANAINASKIVAGAITTTHMTAGTINADRLVARSITADRIATGSITAGEIQSGTITAGLIAAGAITTDKLSVGSGRNLLSNSEFLNRLTTNWDARTYNTSDAVFTPTEFTGLTTNDDFAIYTNGGSGMYVRSTRTDNKRVELNSERIPVKAGHTYIASAYVSGHRLHHEIIIVWYNSSLAYIGEHANTKTAGAGEVSNIPRIFKTQVAPANAAFARIYLRGWTDITGPNTDPYLFISKPMFEAAIPGQTLPGVYSNGSSTLIDAGKIVTGQVSANVIDAEMIRAKVIAATNINAVDIISTGTITANELAVNSVTADKILAGSVKADKIESLAIKSTHIDTDTIEARMIKAGAISADKLAIGGANLVNNSTLEHPISTTDNFNGYDWAFFNYNYTNVVMDGYSSFVDREAMLMLHEADGMFGRPNATQQTADVATIFSTRILVTPGKWYNFSYLTHTEQCNSSAALRFTTDADNGTIYHGGIISTHNPSTYDYQNFQIKRDGVTTSPPLTMERRFISVQAPANAKYLRILLSKGPRLTGTYSVARFTNVMVNQSDVQLTIPPMWSRSGSTLIDGGMIKTGFINANRIAANSIKASHIDTTNLKVSMFNPTTGQIDTTNITPGAIKTSLIDANAIVASHIQAGAISADKLSIGKGVNLLNNGDFSNGFNNGWTWNNGSTALGGYVAQVTSAAIVTKENDADYNFGTTTLKLGLVSNTLDAQMFIDSPKVNVTPGKYYMAQGRIGQHRISTRVEIDFYDSSNTLLQRDIVQVLPETAGNRIDTHNLWFKRVLAPTSASYIKLRTVNNLTTQANPVIWITNYMIEECSVTTTEPSAYTSGGSTLIDGGMIKTNSINANSIIASTLQVTDANISGQITASKLAIVAGDGKIPGTLINGSGITTLGNVQAGSFNLGSGKFTVSTEGTLTATGANVSGSITATSFNLAPGTATGEGPIKTEHIFGNAVTFLETYPTTIIGMGASSPYRRDEHYFNISASDGTAVVIAGAYVAVAGGSWSSNTIANCLNRIWIASAATPETAIAEAYCSTSQTYFNSTTRVGNKNNMQVAASLSPGAYVLVTVTGVSYTSDASTGWQVEISNKFVLRGKR